MKVGKIGEVGETVITKILAESAKENAKVQKDIEKAWSQYINCDWGILEDDDKKMNDEAIKDPGSDRILTKYQTAEGNIYIITEADRSYTTLLFCDEY